MDRSVRGWVAGRVQRVTYRLSFKAEADRLGLVGWVRNLADGRVEFLVSGSAEDVDAVLAWAHDGPRLARVDEVHAEDVEDDETRHGFEIRS